MLFNSLFNPLTLGFFYIYDGFNMLPILQAVLSAFHLTKPEHYVHSARALLAMQIPAVAGSFDMSLGFLIVMLAISSFSVINVGSVPVAGRCGQDDQRGLLLFFWFESVSADRFCISHVNETG